jgi:hypothetical protein
MALGYTVEANSADVQEALTLFQFVGGNTTNAVRIAINRAGPPIKTESSKQIRGQVRLRAKYVGDRLKFTKAFNRKLDGRIVTPQRGILLTRYSTDSSISGDKVSWIRPPEIPARGIKVKVKPSGPIKTMSNKWFYMILPNSRALAIARRTGVVNPKTGKSKIDVAYGPSLSQVFDDVKDAVSPIAESRYQKELLDAVNYLLRKQYPPE